MKDFKKELTDRQELADEATAALEKFITVLKALHREQTGLLRSLRHEGVRIDSCRWLEGDTAGLAIDLLRAGLGQVQPPKVNLTEAVAKENGAILAAIRTQRDFSKVTTRAKAWAGSAHAPQKDFSNLR